MFYSGTPKNGVRSRKHYSFRHLAKAIQKVHKVCMTVNGLNLFPIKCFTSLLKFHIEYLHHNLSIKYKVVRVCLLYVNNLTLVCSNLL
jgi:hypothetical protein